MSNDTSDGAVVFLVDDQPMIGEVVRRVLQPQPDISFSFCSKGSEALGAAIEAKPTVILQDLVMPDGNGFDLLERYRAHEALRNVPVIVLSSTEDPAAKRDAFVRGANDYLVKLPDPIELLARIRVHSKSYRAQCALYQLQRELEAKNAELQRLSLNDSLTGVGNRRLFDLTLEAEWKRCGESGSPLALLLIDIDCFKGFNDHYGHQGGDQCLRQVAEATKRSVARTGDLVARYGGEEFGVILPATPVEGGRKVGERMRQAVSALAIEHAKSICGPTVSISVGVASIVPTGAHMPMELIDQADRALYVAKKGGRNRVVAAPIEP